MEELFTDTVITIEDIREALITLFPGLRPFQCTLFTGEFEPGFNSDDFNHILFEINYEPVRLEFQWRLSIYRTPNEDHEERQMAIASYLAEKLTIRVVISYTLPSSPKDPYYVLLYNKNICYLADDSRFSYTSLFIDEEQVELAVPIKILNSVQLPTVIFDGLGALIE